MQQSAHDRMRAIMWVLQKQIRLYIGSGLLLIATVAMLLTTTPVSAITRLPIPSPEADSYGLEATKSQPAPTQGATISIPGNGASFTTSPITVSGICPNGLLVQVYDNGVLVGAVDCQNGSFTIQVTLFTGVNELQATVFDDLDQAGPPSNTVSVSYNNASFSAFGSLITLTSTYARRAANPGATLTWPLILSGGNAPYAFSIDWGDGGASDLKSIAAAGNIDISHVYKTAGLYHVTVKVTDVNGVSAFLQLVAIATGKTTSSTTGTTKTVVVVTKILWIPGLICALLLFPTYWIGRRSELHSLHRKLEKDMADFREL
jgi:hypothetical protein